MAKLITLLMIMFLSISTGYAHGGGIDSKGGHNCSQKSINKGLCTGYHTHP